MITSNRNGKPDFTSGGEDPVLQEIVDLSREFFPEFDTARCVQRPEGHFHPEDVVMSTAAQPVVEKISESGSKGFPVQFESSDFLKIIDELSFVDIHKDSLPAFSDPISQQDIASANVYRPVVQSVSRSGEKKESIRTAGKEKFNVHAIRQDFPILSEKVNNGQKLVWLDNSATTQKPVSVIERISQFYLHENSNVHRAAHELAARSTDAYEDARRKVASFLNAPSLSNIVFVRGTTEGINLVARSYVKSQLKAGDEIILSMLEHHANIVPWQQICMETGASIRVIPVDDDGQLILSEYCKLFNSRTRFVSVAHVSNALGTITPVGELVHIAHRHGVRILIDGAQSVSHLPIDVQALDADFYVFSGHKVFGPTGIGVVYGKADVLDSSEPYQGGGNMIADVTFEKTLYQPAPAKFEAGTGNIAGAVGLGAALDYVNSIGMDRIERYEHELLVYAMDRLKTVPGLRLIGNARKKASVLSFVLNDFDVPYIGQYLSRHGIAVRAGHHCAQPILRRYGLEATVRPSIAFYNTFEEIDYLVKILLRLR